MVSVRNDSTVVTKQSDVDAMAEACHVQLGRDFCPAWGLRSWNVTTQQLSNHIQAHIVDEAKDVPGALAYHDDVNGKPVIVVMAKTILDAGGTILRGSLSVSAALSHEVVETRSDELATFGAYNANDGWEYALESADPVENSFYNINTTHGPVAVSNFVHPHWFELGSARPYDHLGHLRAPFQIEKGGYVIRWQTGDQAQVNGTMPAGHGWRSLKRVRPSLERAGLIPPLP